MKKKSSSKSAFFNPRALIGFGLCLLGLLLGLLAYTAYPGASLLAQKPDSAQRHGNPTGKSFPILTTTFTAPARVGVLACPTF